MEGLKHWFLVTGLCGFVYELLPLGNRLLSAPSVIYLLMEYATTYFALNLADALTCMQLSQGRCPFSEIVFVVPLLLF